MTRPPLVIRDFGNGDEPVVSQLQEMLGWISTMPKGATLDWRVDEFLGRVTVTLTERGAP